MIYRGYEVEKLDSGDWQVKYKGRHVYVAHSQDDAMIWIDQRCEHAYRRARSRR